MKTYKGYSEGAIVAFVAIIFGIIVLGGIIFANITEKVPAGYEAILVDQYGQNGVKDTPLVTGRVFYNPFTHDLVKYPTFVQTKDYEAFQVQAKDGSTFTVDPNISYRIRAGATPNIYEKYRKNIDEITDTVMRQFVKDSFRIIMNKYTTDEILYKRGEIEEEIVKLLRETAGADGIEIEQLTSGLQYPESIIRAIDAKNQAIQDAQKVENEVKIAEANAKIEITKAEAEANVKKVRAEAEAEALVITAKAEAEANRMKKQELSDLLIKQQFIEKWDGKLPTYSEVPTIMKSIQ